VFEPLTKNHPQDGELRVQLQAEEAVQPPEKQEKVKYP
jgi:hypothetical protein